MLTRSRRHGGPVHEPLRLKLPFQTPLHAASLFGHLAATAVPGVERWADGTLERTMRLPHGAGLARLHAPAEAASIIDADLWLQDLADQDEAINQCRRMLDLDSDPVAVDAALRHDPALAPATLARQGVRIPGTVDSAEFALRAVLGQQVSTAAAATTTGRLVRALGDPLPSELLPSGLLPSELLPSGLLPAASLPATRKLQSGQPDRLFPTAATLAGLTVDDPRLPGMPATRLRTLLAVATALVNGSLDLRPEARPDVRAQLDAIPGVGPWTREIILMRGLGDPDAFPGTDLGVRRGAEALGLDPTPRALERRAERWRPWRSYAVQTLWAATTHPAAQLPRLP